MQTQTHTHGGADSSETIDQLNSFLRGELSAVETYRLALDRLDHTEHRTTLVQCMRSHEERARMLREAIVGRGGDPSEDSGAWGSLVRLIERSAAAIGAKAAIGVLEEGEDHGRDDYLRDLDKLEPSARQLIEFAILPEQRRTHDAIKNVKNALV
jgi:demethoxyubiquinone hydroxylase (CLK1/Coq7/Cat5 family)